MDIKPIILKAIYGNLSGSEREELDRWLEGKENKALYEKIRLHLEERDAVEFLAGTDTERALVRVHRRRRKPFVAIASAVSGIAAAIFIAMLLWPVANDLPINVEKQPYGATITLSTGEVLQLGDSKSIHRLGEASIDISDGEIKVHAESMPAKATVKAAVSYHTLQVPHGESYSITLPDGTRVWVNALSSLKFPSSFDGSATRTVELTGEGFFEVARDTAHPFRVVTTRQTIVVTGTSFNVEAYAKEVSRTTLCRGSVTVETSAGKAIHLHPGQQLSIGETGEAVVAEVNTDIYTAWMIGEYYFDNETLSEVLTKLGKWFEINGVEFTNPEFEQRLFSGKFKKSDGIETILRVIERGINGRIEYVNGRIIIEKK